MPKIKSAGRVRPSSTPPKSSERWPTPLPVFRCPPDCGLCCQQLIIECDALDVLREPRIDDAAPLKKSDRSLPVIDNTWILYGEKGCPFLDETKRCGIYPTRPSICIGFPAGGSKCSQLRKQAGLPVLQPSKADGSMIDRLVAELKTNGDE
jgi:Fe-S-cluster containining protein